MNIFTKEYSPPKTLMAETFCLFPTSQDYSDSDYITVMNNKEHLRIWSQSSWPEDEFTAQMNKEDLLHHIEDNNSHAAYGYMLYSLDKQVCYGSLYVNPLQNISKNYETNISEERLIQGYTARIDCWIDQKDIQLEETILSDLSTWFKEQWNIKVLFSARKEMPRRMAIYSKLGMDCKLNLKSKTSEMTLLLFA